MVRQGGVWLGVARLCEAKQSEALRGRVWQGQVRRSVAWHGMVYVFDGDGCINNQIMSFTLQGAVRLCLAGHGRVRFGKVRHGEAWLGMVYLSGCLLMLNG